jgi:hypothetical protein
VEPDATIGTEPDASQVDAGIDAGGGEPTQDERQPLSFDDAFAQAQEAANEPPPESTPEPATDGKPAAEPPAGAAQPSTPEPPGQSERKPATVEAELDRIYTHIKNGSVDKLPPNLRGRAQAIERDIATRAVTAHTEERQLMNGLKERYLQLELTRAEDPDEFNRLMWEGQQAPELRDFYDTFKREFPGVNLENTQFTPRQPAPAQVRNETAAEIFGDLDQAVRSMVSEAGLPEARVDELRKGAQGPWQYLASAFTESVKAAAEKDRGKIRAEEQKAAALEAQAKWSPKKIVVPRNLGQAAGAPARDTSRAPTWDEAYAEAVASS